jgi:serine/threonine-protein kinase RsbW
MTTRTAMFLARLDSLQRVREFLATFCKQAGLSRDNCLRLNLILEELFTNCVRHGHRGDCEAPIWVTLSGDSSAITVAFEDTAPPFNPFARADVIVTTTLEHRPVGGLGLLLAKGMAASRDYAYVFGRNCVRLQVTGA